MATLDNVSIDISVVLGTTTMPIHQVLRLGRGAIIELDAGEEDEVHILANTMPVARGTVIVSGNRIAVEVKRSCRGPRDDLGPGRARRRRQPAVRFVPAECGRPLSRRKRFVTCPGAPFAARSPHMRPWRNW